MKTYIRTVHEEGYSDGSKTLGVLLNFNDDESFKDSLVYIFHHKNAMYIFFNTMIDMMDYLLHGQGTMKRAYLDEKDFDIIYDSPHVDGKFTEHLIWS